LTQRDALLEAVERLRAGGGTAIYPGLVEAYDMLRDSDSASKHVIVMTDGLSQPGDFEAILAALRGVNATTSFVGIGDGADRIQLQRLAELGGGSFHMTTDFRALPSIMAQEAMLYAADPIERTTVTPEWRGTRPPFMQGIMEAPPPLHGLVRTSTKAEASLHLVGGDDHPLLASWRYGLGRVAAFASQAIGPWAEAWATVAEMQALWPQLIRWVTTDTGNEPSELRVHSDSRTITVAVDVFTDSGAPRRNLVLRASATADTSATGVDGARRMIEVRPGRYEADIPIRPPPNTFTITVHELTSNGPGGPVLVGEKRVVAPSAWAPGGLHPARPLVGELVHVAGGTVLENPAITADLARSALSRRLAWQPNAQAWLVLAMFTFAVTVVLRYLR
jgi:hypothetical protein